jgi:hypothetical protein
LAPARSSGVLDIAALWGKKNKSTWMKPKKIRALEGREACCCLWLYHFFLREERHCTESWE